MASRVVVVVPRQETGLHDYLRKSLACLKDVEVVLDRRTTDASPSDERRQPSENAEHKLLICSLVHCPAPSPPALPQEPPVTAVNGAHRTLLLWPRLRLEDLEDRAAPSSPPAADCKPPEILP
jgi:hypothetical protein